jgi:hypothetical protein
MGSKLVHGNIGDFIAKLTKERRGPQDMTIMKKFHVRIPIPTYGGYSLSTVDFLNHTNFFWSKDGVISIGIKSKCKGLSGMFVGIWKGLNFVS